MPGVRRCLILALSWVYSPPFIGANIELYSNQKHHVAPPWLTHSRHAPYVNNRRMWDVADPQHSRYTVHTVWPRFKSVNKQNAFTMKSCVSAMSISANQNVFNQSHALKKKIALWMRRTHLIRLFRLKHTDIAPALKSIHMHVFVWSNWVNSFILKLPSSSSSPCIRDKRPNMTWRHYNPSTLGFPRARAPLQACAATRWPE